MLPDDCSECRDCGVPVYGSAERCAACDAIATLPPEPAWEAALWDAADEAYERHVDRQLA